MISPSFIGPISRRRILAAAASLPFTNTLAVGAASSIGVTTGSFMKHLTHTVLDGKFRILDLPKIMKEELDLRVLDLMTKTLESYEPGYLDRLRNAAREHDCVITNLKMNQDVDLASPDKATRDHALKSYKETIDVARQLGCCWVRPVAGKGKQPDLDRIAESFDELIDYAGTREISLLIENTGWISGDPNAIPKVIKRVGSPNLTASPDTGNWQDPVRFEGLRNAFPHASTCDFKAYQIEDDGTHPRYDLKRCFDIGWEAGFRGPWCIEHFNESLEGLLAGFKTLGDQLKKWQMEAG